MSVEHESGGVSSQTMADHVYRRLRADILWGIWEPDTPLKSDTLRQAYNIGISPLREALTRLTAEKLVSSVGQRGFRVAPLSAADVMDTLQARILIECEALRLSIANGDVAWETGVVASAHALRRTPLPSGPGELAEKWAAAHYQYHASLIAACGSPWLIQLFEILFTQAERHRICAVKIGAHNEVRDRPLEHDAIFESVLARDTTAALANLERHYRISAENVALTIERMPKAQVTDKPRKKTHSVLVEKVALEKMPAS